MKTAVLVGVFLGAVIVSAEDLKLRISDAGTNVNLNVSGSLAFIEFRAIAI